MTPVRSLLFVPGSRPDRWAKALASGADAVCIDLEDAVVPDDKTSARDAVLAWLDARGDAPCQVGVRINGLSTLDGFKDTVGLAGLARGPDFIMVPKADSGAQLAGLLGALGASRFDDGRVRLWPVVESVAGLRAAEDLIGYAAGGGLLFGGADYSAELGISMNWEGLFHARANLVEAATLVAGVNLLDVPWLDVNDADGLNAECARVKAIGFRGKACIHPSQVAVVNAAFSPDAGEIAWARRVIAAGQEQKGNAILLDGKLLDAPVYLRAERILSQIED